MELVYQYVQALQAAIFAGASVRAVIATSPYPVAVLSVAVDDRCLKMGFITGASPTEQFAYVPLLTHFDVVFDDWPQQLLQMGWYR